MRRTVLVFVALALVLTQVSRAAAQGSDDAPVPLHTLRKIPLQPATPSSPRTQSPPRAVQPQHDASRSEDDAQASASGEGDAPRAKPPGLKLVPNTPSRRAKVGSASSEGDAPTIEPAAPAGGRLPKQDDGEPVLRFIPNAPREEIAADENPQHFEARPALRRIPSRSFLSAPTASGSAAGPAALTAPPLPAREPSEQEKLLLDLVNVERSQRKLPPLRWDPLLGEIARRHGAELRSARRISHQSPRDGADLEKRLARSSYRASAAAENLAFDAGVVEAHRALMQSPGHRRNILDPALENLGASVLPAGSGDWIYVVQDFATPAAKLSDEEAERKMATKLSRASGRRFTNLRQDRLLSSRLDGLLEIMIASDTVEDAVGGGVGKGTTLAFTAADPSEPPANAIELASKADGYALAVSYRRTPSHPAGTYWTILFLRDAY